MRACDVGYAESEYFGAACVVCGYAARTGRVSQPIRLGRRDNSVKDLTESLAR